MQLQLKRVHLIVVIVLCLFTYFHTAANADVIFEDLFNSETPSWGGAPAVWLLSGSDDMTRSTTYAREGASSIKTYLNYDTSSTVYRTEIVLTNPQEISNNFTIGNTYWYAFSVYFSSTDYTTCAEEDIIFQFHGVADEHLGESPTGRNPMFALCIQNDNYELHIAADSDTVTTKGNFDRTKHYLTELGSVELDSWTDFVFMITWDYTTSTTGRINMWKNSELLIEDEGANCFNDATGPYLKFGIYAWAWAGSPPSGTRIRTWYIDRVLISDGDSSYSEMSTHNRVSIPSSFRNAAIPK